MLTLPNFKTVHQVTLMDGVLECNCGYKHRYGIPCHHLFSIESDYDINDVSCRWQINHGYYAYQSEFPNVSLAYVDRLSKEHNGLRMKTQLPTDESAFPYIWSGSQYSKEDIISIAYSEIPICWNYDLEEYPNEYKSSNGDNDDNNHDNFTFTQESVANKENIPPTYAENVYFSVAQSTSITDANLITYFKGILPLYNNQVSRKHLLDLLTDDVKKQTSQHIQRNVLSTINNTQNEFYLRMCHLIDHVGQLNLLIIDYIKASQLNIHYIFNFCTCLSSQ